MARRLLSPQQTGSRRLLSAQFATSNPQPKGRLASAKESFFGSLSSAKEKLGRANRGLQKTGGGLFSNPRASMALLGAAGDVVSSPLAGLTGFVQPELEKGIGFVIDKTPKKAKQAISNFVGFVPDDIKQFAGDTLSASALFALSGIGKTTAKTGIRGTVSKTGKKIIKSGQKAVKAEKASFLDDLVRAKKTPTVAKESARRSNEVGKGIFKKTITDLSPDEKAAKEALVKLKKITKKDTAQGVLNKANKAAIKEAKSLMKKLKKNDAIFNKNELKSRLVKAGDRISDNIFVGSESKPAIQRMLKEARRIIDKNPGKTSGVLRGRMDFDKWLISQKGSNFFTGDKESAIKVGAKEIRKAFNEFVHAKAPGTDVLKSLKKQSTLFDAVDILSAKAGEEAPTVFGRAFQTLEKSLGQNARLKEIIGALTLGTGVLSGSGVPIAGGLGLFFTGKGLVNAVKNPAKRILLGKLIQELSKIPVSGTALVELNAVKQQIENALSK